MSSNYAGISPKNPRSYSGPTVAYPSVVLRSRRPTGADFTQPETGRLYPTSSYWILGTNPTNGVQGELWYLSKIVANVAYWIMLANGSTPPLNSVQVQAATAPGVNPVTPTGAGLMSVNGAIVAAHSVPLETRTRALNAYNIELQVASTVSPTPANTNSVGVACFNSNQFQLDATSGMVSLAGSTVNPALTKLIMQAGTSPIVPDATGAITLLGLVIVAGVNPVQSFGSGANTAIIRVQTTQAIASTNVNNVGLAAFNSAQFSVDANGFVSLVSAGTFNKIVRQVFTANGTYTPTSGMKYCDVEIVGGGGGGGGSAATAVAEGSGGGGGAGGGYSRKIFTSATIGASQSVTIGAGGTFGTGGGATGNAGTTGGTTTFGALISATGGTGGNGGTAVGFNWVTAIHVLGGVGSGGDFNIYGNVGEGGYSFVTMAYGGNGGNSFYGSGAAVTGGVNGTPNSGNPPKSYGSGGSGGASCNGDASQSGSAGLPGICIVTEYCG
jgi:hypothetical protein